MKRLYAVAVTVFLSMFLVVAANAATAGLSSVADVPVGIQNSRKVMQARFDRNKKVHEQQDKAQGKKMEARGGK